VRHPKEQTLASVAIFGDSIFGDFWRFDFWRFGDSIFGDLAIRFLAIWRFDFWRFKERIGWRTKMHLQGFSRDFLGCSFLKCVMTGHERVLEIVE